MKKFYLLTMALLAAIGTCSAAASAQAQALPQRSIAARTGINGLRALRASVPLEHYVESKIVTLDATTAAPEFYLTVPFLHSLGKDNPNDLTGYVAEDTNEDGKTWRVGGFSSYSVILQPASGFEANDDWLISPAIQLKGGEDYEITYNAERATTTANKIEELEVCMGTEQKGSAMSTVLVAKHEISARNLPAVTVKVTPETDGYYYIGFHCTSKTGVGASLKVFNFGVSKYAEPIDPPAAGTLSYTLAPKGELKATVKYVAPTKTVGGVDLEIISKVEIKTNYTLTKEYTDVKPGEVIELEVDGLWQGSNNKLEAIPYLNGVAGEASEILGFFAGIDTPLAPANAKATLDADGTTVTVSWDPVGEVGEKGGYVPVDKVVYYVFDAYGSYYDPALAETSETSIKLDYSEIEDQDFCAYQITAGVDDYYSVDVATNIVTIGKPYTLPFTESFPGCYYEQMWGINPESGYYSSAQLFPDNYLQQNADDEEAEPVYLNSQDGDDGFMVILPYDPNDIFGIFSGKISLKDTKSPVLEFFYQGQGNVLDVLVATNGGDYKSVKNIDLKANPTKDWTMAQIDLAEYKSADYIQVEFRLTARDNTDNGYESQTWSMPLDNIRIRDNVGRDLKLVNLTASAKVNAGENVTLTARVENIDGKESAAYTVELYREDVKIAEKSCEPIAANGFASVTFTDAVTLGDADTVNYEARIVSASDACQTNNSATATVTPKFPTYPIVTDLTGTIEGGKPSLSWSKPAYEDLTTPVEFTEDFESEAYEPLTITDFGGWTLYDGDGLKNYTFLDDVNNPYRTMPMAFQLFNPKTAGVPDNYLVDVQPHSGNTLLVGWSCQRTNDNWLISPELTGDAQTVSFFAMSFSIAYAESFEVLYSTTDKEISSFKKIESVENYPDNNEVPETWTEFKAALPEGAKYFAIRHTSYDTYALYIDDIKFTKAAEFKGMELTGYNVYRNGEKINASTVNATAYTDEAAPEGTNSYRVSALYNLGESRHSQAVELTPTSSIGSLDPDAEGVKVTVANGVIRVEGATTRIAMWDLAGRTVRAIVPSENVTEISVRAGAYVVDADGTSFKVVVR